MKKLILVFLFWVFAGGAASAKGSYVVQNIAVDAQADNAISAREKAFSSARKNGFEIVIKRLGAVDVVAPSDDVIATMVNSFDINREKTSKNRYLASVNVTFNERAVQAYLGKSYALQSPVLNDYTMSRSVVQAMPTQSNPQYKIEMKIRDLRHWLSVKRSFERLPMVSNVSLLAMRSDYAIAGVGYNGDAESLKVDLMRRGLQLFVNPVGQNNRAQYQLVSQR